MKTCFKCGKQKELGQFYRHPEMKDGHLNKCIECTKKDAMERRFGPNRENILSYDRGRGRIPRRIEKNKKMLIEYRAQFPERYRAHSLVNYAMKTGELKRLPCFICGEEKTEAHHPDYSSPLDVVWLCSAHHKQAHAISRKSV